MVILGKVYLGITLDRVAELFQRALEFATQTTDSLGGVRAVALLATAGFVIGLLACMYEIKMIKR